MFYTKKQRKKQQKNIIIFVKKIHSKVKNGKSNRDTSNRSKTFFFFGENHRGRCNCNIYIPRIPLWYFLLLVGTY